MELAAWQAAGDHDNMLSEWKTWVTAQLPIWHRARQDAIELFTTYVTPQRSHANLEMAIRNAERVDRKLMRLLFVKTGEADPLASIQWDTVLAIEARLAEHRHSSPEAQERLDTFRARMASVRRLRSELIQVTRVTRALESESAPHLPRLNADVLGLVQQFATAVHAPQYSPGEVVQQLVQLRDMLVRDEPADTILDTASLIAANIRRDPFMFMLGRRPQPRVPLRTRVWRLLMSIIDLASSDRGAEAITIKHINLTLLRSLLDEHL